MSSKNKELYEFGDFRFAGGTGKLWRKNELILLSPKASELLELLLERGEYVSKEEIFAKVWADTFVEDGVLTQNIYTLRKALGNDADGRPLIENKTRLGYRLAVPIRVVETSPMPPNLIAINESSAPKQIDRQTEKNGAENLQTTFPAKFGKNHWQTGLILFICAILFSLIGVSLYQYLFTPPVVVKTSILEKIRFEKITDTGDVFMQTLSPVGNLVVYRKAAGVYIKDLKNASEIKLEINNVKKFGFLRFSNNGEFLYLRNRASFSLPSDVLKVSRFGGEARKIAENVWSGFDFSPDEKQIAFVRSIPEKGVRGLIIKNLESQTEKILHTFTLPEEFHSWSFPAWSPDGKKIAVVISKQDRVFVKLLILDVKTGTAENLFVENLKNVDSVIWHPQKSTLIVSAREAKNYQIWEILYPTNKVLRITNDLGDYRQLFISKDGSKISASQHEVYSNIWEADAENLSSEKQLTVGTSNYNGYYGLDYAENNEIIFASNEGESGNTNIWKLNTATGEKRQLTVNAGTINDKPIVSPDNKFVYFVSNRTGTPRIWRTEINGEDPTQITSAGNSSESFPQISNAGNTLYFIRKTDKSSAVWKKSLANGQEVQITDEKLFSPANFLALSPDKKYLAFHQLTEKIEIENPKQNFQIAIIETAEPKNVIYKDIGGRTIEVFWTVDSLAFDYFMSPKGNGEIWRQSVNKTDEPKLLFSVPNENIFDLGRSKDGKKIAIARGKNNRDVVLLTNLE